MIFPEYVTSFLWSLIGLGDSEVDEKEIETHGAIEAPILEDHSHYMIFPDWGTSFLWSLSRLDDYEVDIEEIESLYPSWGPFFIDWGCIYDSSFGRQECHSGMEVFEDVCELVAWEPEGILLGCWLALQPHMEEVEYHDTDEYLIKRGTMGEELRRFLIKMEPLLESRQK